MYTYPPHPIVFRPKSRQARGATPSTCTTAACRRKGGKKGHSHGTGPTAADTDAHIALEIEEAEVCWDWGLLRVRRPRVYRTYYPVHVAPSPQQLVYPPRPLALAIREPPSITLGLPGPRRSVGPVLMSAPACFVGRLTASLSAYLAPQRSEQLSYVRAICVHEHPHRSGGPRFRLRGGLFWHR